MRAVTVEFDAEISTHVGEITRTGVGQERVAATKPLQPDFYFWFGIGFE